MHTLLEKLFVKRNIKGKEQLSPDEKQTYETWQRILSKEELTVSDIKDFCKSQIHLIEGKWQDLTMDAWKKSELIPYHTVYKLLLQAIDAPIKEKEMLENQLNQLLQSHA